jgi:hypothetical protein
MSSRAGGSGPIWGNSASSSKTQGRSSVGCKPLKLPGWQLNTKPEWRFANWQLVVGSADRRIQPILKRQEASHGFG